MVDEKEILEVREDPNHLALKIVVLVEEEDAPKTIPDRQEEKKNREIDLKISKVPLSADALINNLFDLSLKMKILALFFISILYF